MTKIKDFEEYLQYVHMEDYRGVDDDAPDDFDNWSMELSPEEWIAYANEWIQSILKKELSK